MYPLAGTFKLRAAKALLALVILCIPICIGGFEALAAGAVGDGEKPQGQIEVAQRVSLTVGTFAGSKTDFLRYESIPIPSLNPDIDLGGTVKLRLELPPDARVRLQLSIPEKGSTSFGLGYKAVDLEYGPQVINFGQAGLAYSRNINGLRLRYGSTQRPFAADVFSAETSSRFADTTFTGDDSFGPYFLGHKNIVEESEQVTLEGERLERGTGPADGDYYVDYKGGFLYFNRVILAHETVRVLFEHAVDDPGLTSVFRGALASYELERSKGAVFALHDRIPVATKSILKDSGSSLLAYGTRLETKFDSGANLENTLLVTDLDRYQMATKKQSEEIETIEFEQSYILTHAPILYQSERVVLVSESEELVRNLDYTMDYHKGELTLMFEPGLGTRLRVEYTHLVTQQVEKMETLQGVKSINRFQFRDEHWRTNTWIEGVLGDFVDVRSQRAPQDRFSLGTSTEYFLDANWSLLANVNATGRESRIISQSSLGGRYKGEKWGASLRFGADGVHDRGENKTASAQHLLGDIELRTFANFKLDFKKRLQESEGILPDELKASAVGLLGKLPFSLVYTHGDKHYSDKIESRLVLPAQGKYTRGMVTLASRYLFKDGFESQPRQVYSVAGNMALNLPAGVYADTRGSLSSSRLGTLNTNTYLLHIDVGGSLTEKALLDYQLRLNGGKTAANRVAIEDKNSLSHTITLAGALTEKVSTALVYRRVNSSRQRGDRGLSTSLEQGFQVSLMGQVGGIEGVVTYDQSTTEVDSAVGAQLTHVKKLRFNLGWETDDLSVKGVVDVGIHDRERRRVQVEFTPAYHLSENVEWWLGYQYITSKDIQEEKAMYRVHLIKTGVTFEL